MFLLVWKRYMSDIWVDLKVNAHQSRGFSCKTVYISTNPTRHCEPNAYHLDWKAWHFLFSRQLHCRRPRGQVMLISLKRLILHAPELNGDSWRYYSKWDISQRTHLLVDLSFGNAEKNWSISLIIGHTSSTFKDYSEKLDEKMKFPCK